MVRHPCAICYNMGHTASGCDKKQVRGALVYTELFLKVRETEDYFNSNTSQVLFNISVLNRERTLSPEEAKEDFFRRNILPCLSKVHVLDLKLLGQFLSNGVVLWIPVLRAILRGRPIVIADEDNVPSTHYKKRMIQEEIFNFMYQKRGESFMTQEMMTSLPERFNEFGPGFYRHYRNIIPYRNRIPSKTLKITVTVDENIMVDDDDDCPICMESMSDKIVIMNCNHKCCVNCMTRVLGTKPVCCLCRAPVNTVQVTNEETSKCFESIRI